ncbi:type VI secretion system tube protein TssD [Myxococcus sp. Y35]|uniref:type VI secretion system tube protein TssD n=1 Tax=Pseudomyxococcus flavus TaxID=3115648 RepID=UPI003CEEE22D
MAESVHLVLKTKGQTIEGESTQTSLGRENTIECVSYSQKVFTAREAGSGLAVGRRQHDGIEVVKRIDKSSPLLMKALCDNEALEGEFKFFRPDPTGDGTTQQFYTVRIKQARITAIEQKVPNSIQPASTNEPPLEVIRFMFHSINWEYTPSGVSHEDTWNAQR